ncbi:MAG: hypothetical protein ACLGIZ_16485 [Acidimicrobiia bacterium]
MARCGGARDLGGLVDVLLDDGEPDAAWALATMHPTWRALLQL